MTAREQVLKAIRDAQIDGKINHIAHDVDLDQPIYPSIATEEDRLNSLALHFAKIMDSSEGYFIYCDNDLELIESINTIIHDRNLSPIFTNDPKIELLFTQTNIQYINELEDLPKARVVVSFCDALVARYGAVLLSSASPCGVVGNISPDVRFVIAFPEQMVENVSDVAPILQKKYGQNKPSVLSLITGPSRTYALGHPIIGVHGTRELYVFYVHHD